MDTTATGPATLEQKLRARLPDNAHIFAGTSPPAGGVNWPDNMIFPAGVRMVTADGGYTELPPRVCAEWTTTEGFWQIWAEEVADRPGRHNVRIDGTCGDLRLDGVTESHLIALLELAGFVPADMMVDIIGPPD